MYGREQRVLLRHYLERGLSKAEVARELGVSRRTVYHWIETGQLDRELDNAPEVNHTFGSLRVTRSLPRATAIVRAFICS